MSVPLRVHHVKRFAAVARVLYKHGRDDWVKEIERSGGLDGFKDEALCVEPGKAEDLAGDLERLGPTFVKLGQLLSSRSDLLPEPYLRALSRLQNNVAPFPFHEVEETISCELGTRMSRAFAEFDEHPIAAASLGQVHLARLRDGRQVAVKVQRPGIRQETITDFEVMQTIAEWLDRHTDVGRIHKFSRHLDELRRNVMNELDYLREMDNLVTIGRNLEEFERVAVPRPVEGYCTSRVLTMEHVVGVKITDVSPTVLLDVDRAGLTRELFDAYLKQVLVDGFFHADPHPGNVLLTNEKHIALLDLGMIARVTPELQRTLLQLLLAIGEGRGEDAADEAGQMAEAMEHPDWPAFRRRVAELVARHRDTAVRDIQVGRVVLEIQHISDETGFELPPVFTMIGKMLLNLDRVAKVLDPEFDPNKAIREQALTLMRARLRINITRGSVLQTLMESGEFVQRLPQRLNRLLDALTQKEFRLHVDAIDEAHWLKGLHKIANRITAGLVLAALIVGAAMLMRVDSPHKIWGYPALALLLFAAAAGGGMVLVVRVLFQDQRHEREVSQFARRKE